VTNFKGLASLVLAATMVSTLSAETHCPGNVASVPFRLANRHQMIVNVSVNHSGPFSFLLDTGAQMTLVEPALAAALHMEATGKADVASVGMQSAASFAQVALLEAGSHSLANQKVLVYDLTNLQAEGLNIQGVLGEDFLEQFDMLIDNGHSLLCLDNSAAMRAEVKGSRIPLQAQAADGSDLASSLIVVARLSDGMRPVRLKLDSGSNVNFLYNTSEYMALGLYRGASLQGGSGAAQKTFMALPLQAVKIGSAELGKVPFITLAGAQKNTHTSDFDGLLTMGQFKRVFIDHADRYAVLDPL
jgi:predicted aspartyl protease